MLTWLTCRCVGLCGLFYFFYLQGGSWCIHSNDCFSGISQLFTCIVNTWLMCSCFLSGSNRVGSQRSHSEVCFSGISQIFYVLQTRLCVFINTLRAAGFFFKVFLDRLEASVVTIRFV